jgi:hypothetical protein
VILPRDFKTMKQFAPALLSDTNGVKYDAKRHNCPCNFTPNMSLRDFIPNQISINVTF